MNANSYLKGSVFLNDVDINSIYQKRPWVAGVVNDNGTILSSSGRYTFAISKLSQVSGGYNIRWIGNPMPSTSYIVYAQRFGASTLGFINQNIGSVIDSSVFTANRFGDPIDTSFSFFTYSTLQIVHK